jgi:rhamnogalacturonan endolyase
VVCSGGQTCESGSCIDSVGADTGGSTGTGGENGSYSTEVVLEEGELGQCEVDGALESTHGGFSGTGYLNSDNAVGASIEWAIDIGAAGTYSLEFAYANEPADDRPAEILIGGVLAASGVTFASTASWATWSSASVDVELPVGENRIILRATSALGLANIDRLIVNGAAVSAFDCDGNSATGGSGTGGSGTGGSGGGMDSCGAPASGHYQMEDLDRGVVAVRSGNGNYVGWRMMGYEYNRENPSAVSYNLYRDGALIASVTDSTNYFDSGAAAGASYAVSVVVSGEECAQSGSQTPWAQNYLRIPLSPPQGSYEANDASPGDLDGDGKYDLVLKWQPTNAKDNSQSGVTDNTLLEGIKLDGTSLWRIDLGRNIRSGAHYTQMSVYDFNGDGRAEVAVKTAPGTRDGTGAYLRTGPAANDDDNADYRNASGYILSGPEYLTVFDGLTGEELATVNYPVPRGNVNSWGDNYGNRVDRFNGGVAMVTDGGTNTGRPSILQQRGYYTRLTMSALHYRNGQLTTNWIFDSNGAGNSAAAGQGDHSAMAADMDGDGGQEINTGALTIGSNGTFRCATGRGHGDAQHVGELIPGAGITVFNVYEGSGGYSVHNGNTCQIYTQSSGGGDNGRGVAADVDPSNPGAEFWSATSSGLRSCVDGSNIGSKPQSQNFLIFWDADESRELQDGASIMKYGGGTLLNASGCSGNNGTKNTPTLVADLLGDWREELVVRESNNSALRVYTTTSVTARRIYTLMHDPTYRMQVSWQQSSYNQPPHTGFHIGSGMAAPPTPDIHVR